MPTQTPLQTGLAGAIGCAYSSATNKLYFVEYGGSLSVLTLAPATPSYKVIGTGYNNPEDVKLSTDGVHAYITERSGDLVKVALTSANRSAAKVVATGMTAPQQFFLDEAHNAAYVVEFASPGRLLKINLTTGVKTVVTAALNEPIGIVVTASLQFAYVSLQSGAIVRVQMSTGAITTLATGLTNPFFLAWADAAQDSIYVPQRDPSNTIATVSTTTGVKNTVVTGVPFRPSSVAVPYAGQLLVCSDGEIEEVTFMSFLTNGPLLMGIGNIPENYIGPNPAFPATPVGKATTPAGSIYQVTDSPFGGTLPLSVNFQSAANGGASYYQVIVDGKVQSDNWTVYEWNGSSYPLVTISPKTVGTTPNCYPVHPVADLFNYQPPALGYELDSTALSNALHSITLKFFDAAGAPIATLVSNEINVLVNNLPCVATVGVPVLTAVPVGPPAPVGPTETADACGVLHYGAKTASTVSLGYSASQPAEFATYSLSLIRGVTPLGAPPLSAPLPGGAVSAATASTQLSPAPTVKELLGPCPTAGFAFDVWVYATMTNGIGRQSQYDAFAQVAFVLTV